MARRSGRRSRSASPGRPAIVAWTSEIGASARAPTWSAPARHRDQDAERVPARAEQHQRAPDRPAPVDVGPLDRAAVLVEEADDRARARWRSRAAGRSGRSSDTGGRQAGQRGQRCAAAPRRAYSCCMSGMQRDSGRSLALGGCPGRGARGPAPRRPSGSGASPGPAGPSSASPPPSRRPGLGAAPPSALAADPRPRAAGGGGRRNALAVRARIPETGQLGGRARGRRRGAPRAAAGRPAGRRGPARAARRVPPNAQRPRLPPPRPERPLRRLRAVEPAPTRAYPSLGPGEGRGRRRSR